MGKFLFPRNTPFWDRVKQMPNGCWEWMSGRANTGYGTFSIHGKTRLAHRLAYEMTYGDIPEGMHVCHRCDNPPCCNPEHLFLGTAKDNARDMVNKGRFVNNSIKLTAEQVVAIRAEYAAGGVTQESLARRYGVTRSAIGFIVRGVNWKKSA